MVDTLERQGRSYADSVDKFIVDTISLHLLADEISYTTQNGVDGSDLAVPGQERRGTGAIDASRLGTSVDV